jgi:prevent-host-death family protein
MLEKVNGTSVVSVTDLRKNTTAVMEGVEKNSEVYVFVNNKPKAVITDYVKRQSELHDMEQMKKELQELRQKVMRSAISNLNVTPIDLDYNEETKMFEKVDK